MMHLVLLCEDTTIVADSPNSSKWNLKIQDNMSGKVFDTKCSHEELASIVSMTVAAENDIGWVENLRPIVERVLEGCPRECSPIP